MLFRLLLQGLATNTHLSELELDISCCEVHTLTYTPKYCMNLFLKLCVMLWYNVAEVGWSSSDSGTHLRGQGHPQPRPVWQRYSLFILFSYYHYLLTPLYTFLFISVRFIIFLLLDCLFHNTTRGVTGSLLISGCKSYLTRSVCAHLSENLFFS